MNVSFNLSGECRPGLPKGLIFVSTRAPLRSSWLSSCALRQFDVRVTTRTAANLLGGATAVNSCGVDMELAMFDENVNPFLDLSGIGEPAAAARKAGLTQTLQVQDGEPG